MLRDITLGQYFPGNSPVHRIDAMVKIILAVLYMTVIFIAKSFLAYGLVAAFTFFVIFLSTVPIRFVLRGLKPLLIFIVFTAVLNLFMTGGTVIWQWGFLRLTREGIIYASLMILRVVFLIMSTSLLTYTTSPIALTDGIERLLTPLGKIGFPTHELAMMMSIALRFIPTLLEETDKIMKAQMARGADFKTGSLIKRAKALIPLLVPLFISAFRRADELAVAMECRCYRGGKNRTRLHESKVGRIDFIALGILIVFSALVILSNKSG
ncbi:MAG: Energy-coupling factor transporter transmembrane protein EcfT [Firmicutes bacterium ADurb.Bin193]|nr:MAG: Energy-coupling factor transporter transmembrane protein EcfT [Firmicutes bacterium ADurb.Bin193]